MCFRLVRDYLSEISSFNIHVGDLIIVPNIYSFLNIIFVFYILFMCLPYKLLKKSITKILNPFSYSYENKNWAKDAKKIHQNWSLPFRRNAIINLSESEIETQFFNFFLRKEMVYLDIGTDMSSPRRPLHRHLLSLSHVQHHI